MFRVSREWATPLTASVFVLMAATGGLMFFHLDSGVQKAVHEWLGWGMVAAVAAHAASNWGAFKRYLKLPSRSLAAIAASVALLGGTFAIARGAPNEAPLPIVALRAISGAPLVSVAPLAGKSVDQVKRDLAGAGFTVADEAASLERITGGDREKMRVAINAVFQSRNVAPRAAVD